MLLSGSVCVRELSFLLGKAKQTHSNINSCKITYFCSPGLNQKIWYQETMVTLWDQLLKTIRPTLEFQRLKIPHTSQEIAVVAQNLGRVSWEPREVAFLKVPGRSCPSKTDLKRQEGRSSFRGLWGPSPLHRMHQLLRATVYLIILDISLFLSFSHTLQSPLFTPQNLCLW